MDKNNNKSLNDILEEYQKIENELINSDGEISSELEEKLNLHELELADKLNGYEHFVRYLKSKIEYLKNMELHYSNRRKVLENSIKRCKKSMTSSLLITGKDKVKTDDFNFSLGKSQRWSINLELLDDKHKQELVDEDLIEYSFKAKLNNIKEKYASEDSSDFPDWIVLTVCNGSKIVAFLNAESTSPLHTFKNKSL